jgi:DUF4097 and DUF4098 domain-containing protein YvlB
MTPTHARRAGAITIIAAAAAALAGCGGVGARLTFNDTVKTKVTEIVMSGGSGDVTVKTAKVTETQITRIIHRNSDPGETFQLKGTVLNIDTDCGHNCNVSYEITAPEGVAVSGELASGDVGLTGIATADVTVRSGDIAIQGATGKVKVKATSGDITVADSAGPVAVETTSGDLHAIEIGGPVTAKVTSGDVDLKLSAVTSVTAEATSGDVNVIVPAGAYQVRTHTGSGDANLGGITNDATSKNVLDIGTGSGDVSIVAAPAA